MATETPDNQETTASLVETVKDPDFLIGSVAIPAVLIATIPVVQAFDHFYMTGFWGLVVLCDLWYHVDRYLR